MSGGSPSLVPEAANTARAATEPPSSFANGRYEVRRFLGEGGKKKVFLAHDTLLDRDVAFALIKTEDWTRQAASASRARRRRWAAWATIRTSSPSTTSAMRRPTVLILPLLPGGDVEGLIEKAADHRLPLDQALKIAIETCRGLEFAHGKGIVHRDLKPGNVWLTEDGTAKIGDFGLAVAIDRSRLTQAGMMVGTVNYMPPEQAMGGEVTLAPTSTRSAPCCTRWSAAGRPSSATSPWRSSASTSTRRRWRRPGTGRTARPLSRR